MRDSVPSGSYSSVCNVLRQWKSRSSLLIESTDSMIYICPPLPLLSPHYIYMYVHPFPSSLHTIYMYTPSPPLSTLYIYIYIVWREEGKGVKNEQKVGMLLQKRTDTRGVGISSMRKSIYLLTTTPSSHTHRFHPLPLATHTSCSPHPLATPIHSTHSPQLSSIL